MSRFSESNASGDAEGSSVRRSSRAWAVLRIALGSAQVIGATAAAYLLLVVGVNAASLTASVATVVCLVASRLLFAHSDRER